MIRTTWIFLFIFISLSLFPVFESAHGANTEGDRVVVYYFHRTIRCHSCNLLEEITRETVRLCFEKETTKGSVELKIINMDDPDKAHFIKDFNLPYQSIVIEKHEKGKAKTWKRMDKVWDLMNEQHKMILYIESEIKKMLGQKQVK
jgi:hypothetical protein